MKALTLTVIGLVLILLASYAAISHESNSYTLKTFVIYDNKENVETNYHNLKINHNNIKTFTIGHKPSGRAMLIHTYKQTQAARKRNILYQQREEEIDKCINKITKNWKRTHTKLSYNKFYDEDEEEPEERWKHEVGSPFPERPKDFYGYDEDKDWNLRWRLKNRALDGKKIC